MTRYRDGRRWLNVDPMAAGCHQRRRSKRRAVVTSRARPSRVPSVEPTNQCALGVRALQPGTHRRRNPGKPMRQTCPASLVLCECVCVCVVSCQGLHRRFLTLWVLIFFLFWSFGFSFPSPPPPGSSPVFLRAPRMRLRELLPLKIFRRGKRATFVDSHAAARRCAKR